MIVALFRILARLLAFLLLALIAVGGIVVAVFCLRGGDATLGLSHLCDLIGLDEFRGTLGDWLGTLEADGPTAALAARARSSSASASSSAPWRRAGRAS